MLDNFLTMLIFLSVIILANLIFMTRRFRANKDVSLFILLLAVMLFYALGYGLNLSFGEYRIVYLFNILSKSGFFFSPYLILIFTLRFIGKNYSDYKLSSLFLAFVPAISVFFLINYFFFVLFNPHDQIVPTAFSTYHFMPEIWLITHHLYSLIYVSIAVFLLLYNSIRSKPYVKRQMFILAISFSIPLLSQILFHPQLIGLFNFSFLPMPFFLSLSGAVTYYGLISYRLFYTTPIMREVLFEKLRDGIVVIDKYNTVLDINSAAIIFLGISEEDAGKNISQVSPFLQSIINESTDYKHSIMGNSPGEITVERSFPGSNLHFNVRIDNLENNPDKKNSRIILIRDISARIETEIKYRKLFDNSPVGFLNYDSKGVIRDSNLSFVNIVGSEMEKLIGLNMLKLPDKRVVSAVERSLAGSTGYFEGEYVSVTGNKITFVRCIFSPVVDNNGVSNGGFGIVEDLSERKEQENAIETGKKKYQELLDFAIGGVLIGNNKGLIVDANRAVCKILDKTKEDLLGHHISFLFTDEELRRKPLQFADLSKGIVVRNERFYLRPDGKTIVLEMHSKLMSDGSYQSIMHDITDKKNKEKEFAEEMEKMSAKIHHADKMESLGQLAGGIAHDFNNLLTGIFGYLDLSRQSANDGNVEDVLFFLDSALPVFERTKDLTRQLLTFSKGGNPIKKIGNIGKQLKDNVTFALSGSSIASKFEIDDTLWYVDYDSNQIGQVFDNLIINAKQAMPLGGEIKVTAKNVTFYEGEKRSISPGDYVEISINDTGIGMSADLMNKIFDPFFTTKKSGTGLGLTTCYSIIQKHGGIIEVYSTQGKGSVFNIFLPRAEADIDIVRNSLEDINKKEHRGSGKIIVLDDEEYIRNIAKSILKSLGYEVEIYKTGTELISKLELKTPPELFQIKAFFLDLTIPGDIGGMEIVGKIKQITKKSPIIASSGYSEAPVMSNPQAFGFDGSLVKPYLVDEISEILNKLL